MTAIIHSAVSGATFDGIFAAVVGFCADFCGAARQGCSGESRDLVCFASIRPISR